MPDRPVQRASSALRPTRRALLGALTGLGAGLVLGAGSMSMFGRPRARVFADRSWRRRARDLAAGDPVELVRQHEFVIIAFHLSLAEEAPLSDELQRLANAITDPALPIEPSLRARAHRVLERTAESSGVPAGVRRALAGGTR